MESAPRLPARLYGLLLQAFEQLGGRFQKQRRRSELQLLEIQQLGEKRFVATVRVGKHKFLIGGAATSVSLLAKIGTQRATVIAARPRAQESARSVPAGLV
jgi:flagellar biogenesis protein FliO